MTVTKFYGFKTDELNQKPVARLAFSEIVALLGSIIQLDARKSSDPEGQTITYRWSFVQVPLGSGLTNSSIRAIRTDWSAVSFTPDKIGFYVVKLIVNDGAVDSDPVTATVDIQLSKVPCGEGIIPDAQFLWSFLSDFWSLVEDRSYIASAWSSIVQLIGSDVITLWSNDYNKSLNTIQNTVQRRWQRFSSVTDLLDERQTVIVVNKRTGKSHGDDGVAGNIGELPGSGMTAVFHAPYGDIDAGYADFERLNPNFGAKGRIAVLNGKGHTIDRVYRKVDPDTSVEQSIIVFDEEDIPDGIVGVKWRVPHLLHVPGVDLEAAGISTGDILVLEIRRDDIHLAAELKAQIVGVDRTRLGFEFSLQDLETGKSTDTDLFRQLVQDLRIIPPNSDSATITAAARTMMSFMPIGINVATRPFSPYRFTIRAKEVLHNKAIAVSDDVISVPALQAQLYEPDVVLRENLDYVVEGGYITFVDGLFDLQSPSPEELWAECVFVDNGEAIESNFGRLIGLMRDDLTQKQTRAPYLSAVKGLFYAATNGPDVANIRLGLQILLGLPFAEERGKIIEYEPYYSKDSDGNDLGRFLIEDVDELGKLMGFRRLYFYPTIVGIEINPVTGTEYKIGDTVEKWAPLSMGVDFQDWVKVPDLWKRSFGGMEILKFFTFKIIIDGNIFDYNDTQFAIEFVRKIKPAYTQIIAVAFKDLYDDIEVEDEFGYAGAIDLYDAGDSRWGLEASIKSDDLDEQGFVRWRYGSRPFSIRTLRLLRDIQTYKDGTDVKASSVTGWNLSHIRGRIEANASTYSNAPIIEGDILVIAKNQAGSFELADGLYEIEDVLDANTLQILQQVQASDPSTMTPDPIDADGFQYGSLLSCYIVRRALNPVLKSNDLVTDGTDTVTSASAKFITNGVSPDDHLIIESGANLGEYRIDVVTTNPLNISETQLKLKDLDGSAITLPAGTGQNFRIIRYSMMRSVVPGARTLISGADVEIEMLDGTDPLDVFTPGLVGTTVNVSGSEDPANDGDFTVSAYIHAGRIRITNPLAVNETDFQATVRLNSIWHPGFEKVEEGTPSEAVTFELIPV